MPKKPQVRKVQATQQWLFDYLDTEIDPYDFDRYLPEWAMQASVRLPEETYVADMKPAQQKKFEKWLIDQEKGIDWVSTGDIYAPAYLYFDDVTKLPPGAWCIHFTDSEAFQVFEQGTTLEGLALSSHKKEKDMVDCKRNLRDDIGSFETVFGFAFSADERNILFRGQKYGRHAVLFQTDGGVRAWHIGDEENQVIFPLCSEYNVIPLLYPEQGDIRIQTEGGEEAVFESLDQVITYVTTGEKREILGNPSRRLARLQGYGESG